VAYTVNEDAGRELDATDVFVNGEVGGVEFTTVLSVV